MFVKLDPDHVNWDCYLIKTTGKRIGWKKSGFVFFSLNSFFFCLFAYAVCTMWNNNYVMNISKLPRVIINCTCDMEQQLFANTWFNYQFTETKKTIRWRIILYFMGHNIFNGMQKFWCKIRWNRDGAKLNLMNSFQMSDILKAFLQQNSWPDPNFDNF